MCDSKLAYLYIKTGNLDAALSHYQYLLDTAPQFNEEIALKIALLYFEQGNFADAEILFRRITAENPENQHAHYYLGHVLVKTLKPEEAARLSRPSHLTPTFSRRRAYSSPSSTARQAIHLERCRSYRRSLN